MIDKIINIFDFMENHPILLISITLLLTTYRKTLSPLIKKYFGPILVHFTGIKEEKKTKSNVIQLNSIPIISGTKQRIGVIYPRMIICQSEDICKKEMNYMINFCRKENYPLTFSFVNTESINLKAMKVFKEVIEDIAKTNGIEMKFVFPVTSKLEEFKKWVCDIVEKYDANTMKIVYDACPKGQCQLQGVCNEDKDKK